MAKLDKLQTRQLKNLVKENVWDILILAMGNFRDRVLAETPTGTNEFEFLRDSFLKQGKVDGLREFFDEIEKLNFTED